MQDANGIFRPSIFQVADLYVEQHHWAYLIGPLSGEATAVLSGFMQYPRKSHAVTVSRAKHHDSWTCNPIARVAPGSKMGGYMYSSTLRSMARLLVPCALWHDCVHLEHRVYRASV